MTVGSESAAPVSAAADSMVVVFDDPAGPFSPGAWSELLASAGFAGEVVAPMPAGWFQSPPPVGGHAEVVDPLFEILDDLGDTDRSRIAIGVGGAGWPATLVALAGRASALVLIDGCGGPWLDPVERSRRQSAALAERRDELLGAEGEADSGSGRPAGSAVLRSGHHNRALAFEAADELVKANVAVLLIETPQSTTPAREVGELGEALGSPPAQVGERTPTAIAEALKRWVQSFQIEG